MIIIAFAGIVILGIIVVMMGFVNCSMFRCWQQYLEELEKKVDIFMRQQDSTNREEL